MAVQIEITDPLAPAVHVPEDVKNLIESLYSSQTKVGLAATGSGGAIFHWLLAVPGCSSSVLTADVPYAMAASREYLKAYGSSVDPEQAGYCSREMAEGLARAAFTKAARLQMEEVAGSEGEGGRERCLLGLGGNCLLGVGITAGVVSTRPKRGKHRVHVASYSPQQGTVYYYLELSKGDRDRCGEDSIVSRIALRAILHAAEVDFPPEFGSTALLIKEGKETIPEAIYNGDNDALASLYDGMTSCALQIPVSQPAGAITPLIFSDIKPLPKGTIIFPGSFNPLHEGHMKLLKAAQDTLTKDQNDRPPVIYEIAAFNADKPPLSREVLEARLAQFIGADLDSSSCVAVTKAPLFVQKARLFPHSAFIIGADTAQRLVDPKYYNQSEFEMVCALSEIQFLGCRFIVGGRNSGEGFITLQDVLLGISLPGQLMSLFVDVSSTELREKQNLKKPRL